MGKEDTRKGDVEKGDMGKRTWVRGAGEKETWGPGDLGTWGHGEGGHL
jgi:rhoptry neck protein 2